MPTYFISYTSWDGTKEITGNCAIKWNHICGIEDIQGIAGKIKEKEGDTVIINNWKRFEEN